MGSHSVTVNRKEEFDFCDFIVSYYIIGGVIITEFPVYVTKIYAI